jgi:hypothetical protein
MRKEELVALRMKKATFKTLIDLLPTTFDTLGITFDHNKRDGAFVVRDHGDRGCVITLGSGELAQRTARALAPKLQENVVVFEVNGTDAGGKFKFRAAASEATVEGHLRDASGVELDFDDPEQTWGGGNLEARAKRVLREFGELPQVVTAEQTFGYKRRSGGRPSSERVSALLATLKKTRTWEGVALEGGRIELKMELAKGGKQSSFCTAAEFEELKKLTGHA